MLFWKRNNVDMLFCHLKLCCYVVIELKACDFEPRFNMYQNIVNDILRHPSDNLTIGLLLVKGKIRQWLSIPLRDTRIRLV